MKSPLQRKLPNERIDLPPAQQRFGWIPLRITAHEVVLAAADFERGGAGIVHSRDAVLFAQRQDTHNASHRRLLRPWPGTCRGKRAPICVPALSAQDSRSRWVPRGVLRDRSSSFMQCPPRAQHKCSLITGQSAADRAGGPAGNPTAPARAFRSIPVARCWPLRLYAAIQMYRALSI